MLIRLGYEWIFDVPSPTPVILKLYLHPSQLSKVKKPEKVKVEPETPIEEFIDEFGNQAGRLMLPPGRVRVHNETIISDSGEPDRVNLSAQEIPIEQLPVEVLPYLLASRYCEVDLLSEIAWELFGESPPGWGRVQAVCDWVHSHVDFGYEYASSTKTAYQVYQDSRAVCRDFMHLAMTFCRCLNIPARAATGYLGNIRMPPSSAPIDFSSWFEVYLDHQWYSFDARYNVPRIGRILMARGRDAVDVALTTSFGTVNLEKLTVFTEEI
ncbi:MAG: hypothetical protein RLZZ338_697 [Cyanobacteriota bacterium]